SSASKAILRPRDQGPNKRVVSDEGISLDIDDIKACARKEQANGRFAVMEEVIGQIEVRGPGPALAGQLGHVAGLEDHEAAGPQELAHSAIGLNGVREEAPDIAVVDDIEGGAR